MSYLKRNIVVYTLLFGILGLGQAAQAADACSGFLSNKVQDLPLSVVYQDSVYMSVDHMLVPAGIVRLHDLRQEAQMNRSRVQFVEGLVRSIHEQHPDIDVLPTDGLLVLNIKGDKFGLLKNLGFQKMIKEGMDILGLHSVEISHKVSMAESGVKRLVFVIKPNPKDFRELRSEDDRLKTIEDVRFWIASLLTDLYDELLGDRNFAINQNPTLLDKIYKVMGRNPNTSPDSDYAWMPKSDFVKNYNRALLSVMNTLNARDLLYTRSSFWDEVPEADDFSRVVFQLLNQGLPIDILENGYAEKALAIREKIYRAIHKKEGNSRSSSSPMIDESSNTISRSRGNGEEVHALSGVGAQEFFGNDFFTGARHQNIDLAELKDQADSMLIGVVERLERHGYVEVAQLQRASAHNLMDRANLSIDELVSLARELTTYGVYLTYQPSVLYRLSPEVRSELRPPMGQNFEYRPSTNTYRPR